MPRVLMVLATLFESSQGRVHRRPLHSAMLHDPFMRTVPLTMAQAKNGIGAYQRDVEHTEKGYFVEGVMGLNPGLSGAAALLVRPRLRKCAKELVALPHPVHAAILGEWLVILMNVSSPIAFRFRRYIWRQQQALSQRFSILRPPLFPRPYLLRAGCG